LHFDYKMVILSRKDLKLSKGKLAVQVAHAAVTCSDACGHDHNDWLEDWINEGQKKVVLEVDNRQEMFKYYLMAKERGLPCCAIRDAGLTEIPPGTITVVGIGPAPEDVLDRITGELKLL